MEQRAAVLVYSTVAGSTVVRTLAVTRPTPRALTLRLTFAGTLERGLLLAPGQAVTGDSPGPMNWLATSESTLESNRLDAQSVARNSPVLIISQSTLRFI